MKRLILIATAVLSLGMAMACAPAMAGDTTPNNLSTEQEKIYLLPDGTWVKKVIVVDPATGADTNGTAGTGYTQPTGGTGLLGYLSGIYHAFTNTLSVGGSVASGVANGGNPVKVGCVYAVNGTITPAYTLGTVDDCTTDQYGNGRVALGLVNAAPVNTGTSYGLPYKANSTSSTVPLGVGTYRWDSLNTLAIFDVVDSASARLLSSAATTNSTLIKNSACTIFSIDAVNTTASVKYLKIYNKASAPTVGTDTPFMTMGIPPSNANFSRTFPGGVRLATGCGFAETGAAADSDTTAVAVGDVVALNITYN